MVSIPQAAKCWADVARGAAPTSSGNQSFVFDGEEPGDGPVTDGLVRRSDPKIALFFGTNATANDTATDDAVLFFGACQLDEGGSEKNQAMCTFAEHNVSTTNTVSRGASDVCCMIIDSAGAVDGEAAFASISQDGTTGDITVTINWSNAPSVAILVTCIVIGGTAVSVDMATHNNSGSANNGGTKVHTLSNLDIEPTILLFQTAGSPADPYQDVVIQKGRQGLGFACHNGTAIEQAGQTYLHADGVSTTAGRSWQGWTNRVLRGLIQTIGPISATSGAIEISDMTTGTAGEYETTTRDWPGGTSTINWGVIGIGIDTNEVDVHVSQPLATNGGTGTQTWDVGHTPILNLYLMSMMNTNSNVHFASNIAQPHGIGVMAGDENIFTASIASQRNVSTSNTQSRVDSKPVNLNTHSGGTGHQADYDSLIVGTGHVVDWTSHNGAAADGFKLLSIQRAPTVVAMDVVDGALQLAAGASVPVTPVDPATQALQLQQTPPEPVMPVPPPVSIMRYVVAPPDALTPVAVAAQLLQLVQLAPDAVTPALLQAVQALQFVQLVPDVVVPVLLPAAQQLQLVGTVPAVVTPVTPTAEILRLVSTPPSVVVPVLPGVQVIRLASIAPSVATPVQAPLSALQLQVGAHVVLSPVLPPASILQLVAIAPSLPVAIPPPVSTLRLQTGAHGIVTPPTPALQILQFVSTAPTLLAPVAAPHSLLQLVAFAPVISDGTGDPVTIVVPLSLLRFVPSAPKVITGQGCYVWLQNMLRTRFESLVQEPRTLPTIYENSPVEAPETGLWADFQVEHTGHRLHRKGGAGRAVYRKEGNARVRLYVPAKHGTQELVEAADAIDSAFRYTRDLLVYGTPSLFTIGREGRWWAIEVRCPWYYDEEHPTEVAGGGGFVLPDFEAIVTTIQGRFEIEVEVPQSVVTIYDNDPEDPPESVDPGDLWIRWNVRPGDSFRAENGGAPEQTRYRTPGVAIAEIRGRLKEGNSAQLAMADIIVPLFRGLTDTGITYKTPRVENVGRDGRWWQINVVCPFYSDAIA